ncbi:MAG: pyruvate ferredoxin oxidoreductase [Prevotella sp.]|nr:pyruvate ferredoxin oxidoreductase [Prevotella sp.]
MDYKYIEQLLERYWKCETSLEEEEILRTFFSQKDVPVSLLPYQEIFAYAQNQKKEEVLDNSFDLRILSIVNEGEPVKARTITMHQRLMPLFKAAAIVAIILTLGNAMQVPFSQKEEPTTIAEAEKQQDESSVAVIKADTIKLDTLKQTIQQPTANIK